MQLHRQSKEAELNVGLPWRQAWRRSQPGSSHRRRAPHRARARRPGQYFTRGAVRPRLCGKAEEPDASSRLYLCDAASRCWSARAAIAAPSTVRETAPQSRAAPNSAPPISVINAAYEVAAAGSTNAKRKRPSRAPLFQAPHLGSQQLRCHLVSQDWTRRRRRSGQT